MKKDLNNKYLCLYLFLLFGYIFSQGFYSLGGFVILFFVLINLIIFRFKKNNFIVQSFSKPISGLERITLLFSICFSLVLYGGAYQNNKSIILISIMLVAVVLFMVSFSKNISKNWLFIIFIYLLLGTLMIISSPEPKIDIFYFLKEGAVGLLQGKNPYSMIFTRIPNYQFYYNNIPNFYSYLPGMIFLTGPGVWFFGDPRISILIAQILTAYLIGKMLKNKILSLIFLFNPLSLFILEQSWTEPIIVSLLVLIIYFFSIKKYIMVAIVYGLMLSTKQYAFLFLPFIWQMMEGNRKKLIYSVLVGLTIILPFVFWNWKDFLNDAVLLQFKFPIRYDGLTFTSFLYNEFKIIFPAAYQVIIWLLGFIFLYFTKQKWTTERVLLVNFILIFIFFFFNKWAFANYYYLLSSYLLLIIGRININ